MSATTATYPTLPASFLHPLSLQGTQQQQQQSQNPTQTQGSTSLYPDTKFLSQSSGGYPSYPLLHSQSSLSGTNSTNSLSLGQGYGANETSPSSSSVEPVTPELTPSLSHAQANAAIKMENGSGKDGSHRRVSDASALSASAGDADDNESENIECKWAGCTHFSPSADELYDHLCNHHVGRKSTGNLNLTCGWEGCGVKCVKRDHITSHLRVHTPLKPHPCSVCGKTFKRPQDLKKHERIHTQEHHQLHKLSKATTSSDPAFNQRVGPIPTKPSYTPSAANASTTATASLDRPRQQEPAKPASPTPSALAALHRKQHEELAAHQQREMAMLQQLAFQQQQTQAYAAQFATQPTNKGVKRDTEDAFGDLWSDMKKRKVQPVYNADMVSRLNNMVPPAYTHMPSMNSHGYPAPAHSMSNPYAQYNGFGHPGSSGSAGNSYSSSPALGGLGFGNTAFGASNGLDDGNGIGSGGGGGGGEIDSLPFPEIKSDADLAMFNQFMISLGRDAALGGSPSMPIPQPYTNTMPMTHSASFISDFSSSSVSSGSPLSDQSPIEDLFNPEELASLGLGGMPGIPALPPAALAQPISFGNIYPALDTTRSRASSAPDINIADLSKRAIAGLPRNHSMSMSMPQATYPELPLASPFRQSGPMPAGPSTDAFDFDSLVRAKPGLAATIQPRDFHKKVYRHVAPLGTAVSARNSHAGASRLNESSLRTEVSEYVDDEDDDSASTGGFADSPEQMDTPKISVRSLLTSDDLPDGEDLLLPRIHSPHDDNDDVPPERLPSVRDIEGYRPPSKRHTDEELVRGVKRLELDSSNESKDRSTVKILRDRADELQRRKHAALIRAWLVAVNLEYRQRRLEESGEVQRDEVEAE